MAYLDSDGANINYKLGFFFHIVVYSKIADAKLIGSYRIRTHRLALLGLNSWLVKQLLVHGVQNNPSLASRQCTQVVFSLG